MKEKKSFYEEIKEISAKRDSRDKFFTIEFKKLKKAIKKRANKGFNSLLVKEQDPSIVILFCNENTGFECDITTPGWLIIKW